MSVTIGLKTGHSFVVDGSLKVAVNQYESAREATLLLFNLADVYTHPEVQIRRDSIEYIAEGPRL